MPQRNTNIPASYLTLLKDGKILLLERFNTGYEDGNYSMIAGHVDAGETFTQAIIREATEEAGIILQPENISVKHVMHRKGKDNERVDTFFIATSWAGSIINKEPHKCSNLTWFDLNHLPLNIVPCVKYAIECIKDNIFYSEFGW